MGTAAIRPLTDPPSRRPEVILQGRVAIPGWVEDLDSYRRWAHSDAFPKSGWISFLNKHIWVDVSMEEFITHNQVKQAYNVAIGNLLGTDAIGRFVPDRMLLTNVAANLSTEPDGLFFFWATLQSGRLRLVPGKPLGRFTAPTGMVQPGRYRSVQKQTHPLLTRIE